MVLGGSGVVFAEKDRWKWSSGLENQFIRAFSSYSWGESEGEVVWATIGHTRWYSHDEEISEFERGKSGLALWWARKLGLNESEISLEKGHTQWHDLWSDRIHHSRLYWIIIRVFLIIVLVIIRDRKAQTANSKREREVELPRGGWHLTDGSNDTREQDARYGFCPTDSDWIYIENYRWRQSGTFSYKHVGQNK